jgi:hypothetical protein
MGLIEHHRLHVPIIEIKIGLRITPKLKRVELIRRRITAFDIARAVCFQHRGIKGKKCQFAFFLSGFRFIYLIQFDFVARFSILGEIPHIHVIGSIFVLNSKFRQLSSNFINGEKYISNDTVIFDS